MVTFLKKNRKKNYLPGSGFTIIEVMVAVSIISVGLLGVVSLVQQNIQVGTVNKNAIIASQLAQEGIEVVRKIRDSNWRTEAVWDNGLAAGTSTIDYNGVKTSLVDVQDISNTSTILKIDSNGFYQHALGSDSPFRRIIVISDVNPDYLLVTCQVRYKRGKDNRDYIAQTYLYNWRAY